MTIIRFVTGKSSGILSDISSGTLSGIPSGILSSISSGILSGISSHLSGISSGILSDMLSGVLSGISSGILSGRSGPVVPTELGRSQAEVQRCSLSSEGGRLRSSGAHSYRTPAVEVQQCPLHAEVGEELARRKWTWKWMQRWWRRSWRRGRRRRRRWRMRRRRRRTTVIKSNNPHLAGREKILLRMKHSGCNTSSWEMTFNSNHVIASWFHYLPFVSADIFTGLCKVVCQQNLFASDFCLPL